MLGKEEHQTDWSVINNEFEKEVELRCFLPLTVELVAGLEVKS